MLSEGRATAPKQNKPNCNRRSQLVFLSDICGSVATCFPVSYPSLTIPQHLCLGVLKSVWFFCPASQSPHVLQLRLFACEQPRSCLHLIVGFPAHRMRVGRVLSHGLVLLSQRQTSCSLIGHTVTWIKRQIPQISSTAYFTEHRLIMFMLLLNWGGMSADSSGRPIPPHGQHAYIS